MRQNKYIPVCVGAPPRLGPTLFTHPFFFSFSLRPNTPKAKREDEEEEEGQGDEEEMKANRKGKEVNRQRNMTSLME